MDWTEITTATTLIPYWDYNGDSNNTSSFAVTVPTPDPLIDWTPYKWKKYIPAWHIMKSFGVIK